MDPTGEPVFDMPMAIGIDGYHGGWVAARLAAGSLTWSVAAVDDIGTLIPSGATVGIDIPVGLLETGERPCDALARHELPGAASRVFTTPRDPSSNWDRVPRTPSPSR